MNVNFLVTVIECFYPTLVSLRCARVISVSVILLIAVLLNVVAPSLTAHNESTNFKDAADNGFRVYTKRSYVDLGPML